MGAVMAREARDAGSFTINGHARRLWVVPVSGGGFCYEFERVGGKLRRGLGTAEGAPDADQLLRRARHEGSQGARDA